MNLRRIQRQPSDNRGAALLAALCFTLVLAIALSSYITVCYRTLQMSTRNVGAGHTVELAETGMEEALWALQNSSWGTWTISGTTATKTLSNFSYDNGYTGSASLTIDNYNSGTRTITVVGTVAQYDSGGTVIPGTLMSRTLTSTAAPAALFVNAIGATTGRVRFRLAGTVDSYDSSVHVDPTVASQLPYRYSAMVSSGATTTASPSTVRLLNATIKGYVSRMPTSNETSFTSTSTQIIGPPPPAAGSTPVGVKIDLNRIGTSPYQPIFDVVTPSAVTPVPTFGTSSSTNTIGTVGAATPSTYYCTGLTLSGSQILYINGPVVLVIAGTLDISSSAKIVINNVANASLEIHIASDLLLKGNGIDNQTLLPKKLAILQTANSSIYTWDMGTDTPFYGVIYTPTQTLNILNPQTINGSIVAASVTFGTSTVPISPTFHYDLNLRLATFPGLSTPYAVSSVREVGP